MRSIDQFVHELDSLGFHLFVKMKVDGKKSLSYRQKKGVFLSDKIRKDIKSYAPDILKHLEKKEIFQEKSSIQDEISRPWCFDNENSLKITSKAFPSKNEPLPTDITDIGSISTNKIQDIDFPQLWLNAIAVISTRAKPQAILETRWKAITKRLDVLIHEESPYFLKMIEYGWPLEEIFGCHKFAPDVRIDSMGLLILMTHTVLAEIKSIGASLKHKDGAVTTYYLGRINHNRQEQSTLMEIE